jgi:hypothetical protein
MHHPILLLALGFPCGTAEPPMRPCLVVPIERAAPGHFGPVSTLSTTPLLRGAPVPKYGALSVPSATTTPRPSYGSHEAPVNPVDLFKAARSVLKVVTKTKPGMEAATLRR